MGNHEAHGGDRLNAGGQRQGPPADDPFDPREQERGRLLFARPCAFLLGAVSLDTLPASALPEVAFAGRSNVGKSSLINALTGRRTLARTSNTPGRTREINFFLLGDPAGEALHLVDLPGYGYARVSKHAVDRWTRLVRGYLRGRPNLRRVYLLIDARRGIKDSDRDLMKMLDVAAVSFQAVMTKTDKLKSAEAERRAAEVAAELVGYTAAHPALVVTSARSGLGIEALRAWIAALAVGS